MKILITSLLLAIFLFLSVIHIYWGLGGKKGITLSVPSRADNTPVIYPGAAACIIVALGFITFALFTAIKSGIVLFALPTFIFNYGLWAISLLFIVRSVGEFKYVGFFKKVKTTRFERLDTLYYSPLCLLIGLLSIMLATL